VRILLITGKLFVNDKRSRQLVNVIVDALYAITGFEIFIYMLLYIYKEASKCISKAKEFKSASLKSANEYDIYI